MLYDSIYAMHRLINMIIMYQHIMYQHNVITSHFTSICMQVITLIILMLFMICICNCFEGFGVLFFSVIVLVWFLLKRGIHLVQFSHAICIQTRHKTTHPFC